MKRNFLLIVFLGFICHHLVAQPGHYFLSHYKPGNDNISYLSFDIEQDHNGILYFANPSGVLQFDGRNWAMVPVEGAVYSLVLSTSGEVFAGGSQGFGKIGLNAANHLSYLSLSDSLSNARNVFASCAEGTVIYFLNEEGLFQFDVSTSVARSLLSVTASQGSFTGLFKMESGIYVSTEYEGLKKLVAGSLQSSDLPDLQGGDIVFCEPAPNRKKDLIVTEDNRFYIKQQGIPIREFKPKDSVYLTSNVIANASWVNDRMIAIGTLRGGVVFLDVESDNTYEISNYHTGLPDNEVYALYTDRHLGIWVAHDYGFTRIAPFLPFRTYNHYKGLQGNLLCVLPGTDPIYVGTTLGLFRLSKEEIYEDEVYTVTSTYKVKSVSQQPKVPAVVQQDKTKGKRSLFGVLKKKNKNEELARLEELNEIKETARKGIRTITQQKTRRVLKGIEFVYKQVEGISGKVDQLLRVDQKIISAGVGGVFEVADLKAVPVSSDPSRLAYYSKNLNQLLISTYNDEIKSFRPSAKGWEATQFPDTLSAYADYMFEDNLQDLWICGHDRAVKIGIEEGEILDAESIPLPHSSIDRTVGLAYGAEVYLTQNGKFYHYASFKNVFVQYDSLPGPKKYFASAGVFWFYDGHRWRTVDQRKQGAIKTEWLSLFPDIRFLTSAEQAKSLWVITSSNDLYLFSSEQNLINQESNPLFLKEARNQQAKLAPASNWKVDEGESSITLEFIQPEYFGEQATEYRYWVQGLQKQWSEWASANNIVNFSFLPPGDYKVLIQAKDLFGKITELNTIHFNVVPPYWQRPWFYALEFLFFGSLVVLSLRLNVANTRYHYLSRFLSALTVVLLIQFIQTIASSNITVKSTPVADFFIQVCIALLVLPVEQFLRNRMIKASEKKH